MKLSEFKQKVNTLLIFNKNLARNFEPRRDVLDANLKYWLKRGELIALKKGCYALQEKYQDLKGDDFLEYVTNQLVQPSYLSLEYVMAKHQLLSEPVNALTSVTIKVTREIKNKLGVFRYYSLAPELFVGYKVRYFQGVPIFEAEKSKAVFDYLYLYFIKKAMVNEKAIKELRLNWENIKKTELKQIETFANLTALTVQGKMKKILMLIRKIYYA